MIIKKYTGGAWVAQSPKVTYTDIVDSVTAGTPTSIFSGGKLLASYLPDFVFGGLKFQHTIASTQVDSDSEIAAEIESVVALYGIEGAVGSYWIASDTQDWDDAGAYVSGGATNSYGWSIHAPNEEDDAGGVRVRAEAGDWIVITKIVLNSGNNYDVTLGVVNNTYATASSTQRGIIKIGYSENGKNYPIELDGSQKAFVNVPWDDVSTANVRAAGALMDDELTSLSGVKTLTVPDSTTISTFGASLIDDSTASAALTTLGVSAFAKTLLDDASASAVLTTLGVDTDVATLSLPGNTSISTFGASLIDDADAAAGRATLGVDAAGTDNSTDVTLAGSYDYLTIDSNQVITRNQVDYATDISNKPTASDGLELDGDNFEMEYPLYVVSSDPTGTIKDDAIAFVG